MEKTFFIETYGCQMNVAESNGLDSLLIEDGWKRTAEAKDALAVILNTCSVRQTAENRIWGRLGYFRHIKDEKQQILVLAGCMAERIPEELTKKAKHIDFIVGTNNKAKIVSLLDEKYKILNEKKSKKKSKPEIVTGFQPLLDKQGDYPFIQTYYKLNDYSSYVPIMNGCNNFCTYCIVPYVRGREVSRDAKEIAKEIQFLDSQGVKEICLLGQNVNSYKFENLNFADLLHLVCKDLKNIEFVRFESPHPKDFSDEVIEAIATERKIARHLHIPMQSGSTKILNSMNRRYTSEQYITLIDKIKKRIPECTFSTDVMVGFPGESQEDFQKTLDIMENAGFLEAFMYYWNPREGTKAVDFPNKVSQKVKLKRLEILIDKQLERTIKIKNGRLGGVQKVLVTQVSRDNPGQMLGKNEHGEMIVFNSKKILEIGSMIDVKFICLKGNTFVGELLNE